MDLQNFKTPENFSPADIIGASFSGGPQEKSGDERLTQVSKNKVKKALKSVSNNNKPTVPTPPDGYGALDPNHLENYRQASVALVVGASTFVSAVEYFDSIDMLTEVEKEHLSEIKSLMDRTWESLRVRLREKHEAECANHDHDEDEEDEE